MYPQYTPLQLLLHITIFGAPARAWLAKEIDDAGLVAAVRSTFEGLIDAWRSVHP